MVMDKSVKKKYGDEQILFSGHLKKWTAYLKRKQAEKQDQ